MNENKNQIKQNILVMRLSSLGDIVLLSPVFKNIKDHWPNAKITLLVKEQFAQRRIHRPRERALQPLRVRSRTLQQGRTEEEAFRRFDTALFLRSQVLREHGQKVQHR